MSWIWCRAKDLRKLRSDCELSEVGSGGSVAGQTRKQTRHCAGSLTQTGGAELLTLTACFWINRCGGL